ncbi:sulfotransferase family 2 domain-containing protein [Roseivivax sp. CAU 1761]
MSVPHSEVAEAFRFFLRRPPNPDTPPSFDTTVKMHDVIMGSDEFRQSPRALKTPLGWPLNQVFVSHPAKVVYCPIGKNACTFMKRQMVRVSGLPDIDYILPHIHLLTDHVRTGAQLSDYEEQEARRVIADPSYLKFAILRDPAERLLSAYVEKFVLNRLDEGNQHHTRRVVWAVQAALGLDAPDFDRGISFRDFVTTITSQDPRQLDPHWRPQHLYLEGIDWDRFYPVTRINEAIDMLEARSGLQLARQPENTTGSGRGEFQAGAADLLPAEIIAGPKLSKASYFDDDLVQRVSTYYATDRELFESGPGMKS